MSYRELLIGCGNSTAKRVTFPEVPQVWQDLTTLDFDKGCQPDVVHDLNELPYPFEDNTFDEIHAYEVLEHTGKQGDFKFFFDQFYEFWRILKPNGYFCATVPMWDALWAWSDPGHTRIITKGSLIFLNQAEYNHLGKSSMTDYRKWWKGDFDIIAAQEGEDQLGFCLRARK